MATPLRTVPGPRPTRSRPHRPSPRVRALAGRGLAACLLLALLPCGPGSALEAAEHPERIGVRTIYLTHPVGDVHRITIEGALGGPGRLQLDANRCGQNLFGDATICAPQAVPEIPVRLVRLPVKDPRGEGRRVYRLEGELHPHGHRYYLVVPPGRAGNYRLAILDKEGRVRVLSLEELSGSAAPPLRPASSPSPDPRGQTERQPVTLPPVARQVPSKGYLGRVTYTAVQGSGRVTIQARGEHPGPGFMAGLQPMPGAFATPVHRLVIEPPPQSTPGAPVGFYPRAVFHADQAVPYVYVFDADGRHRVPVARGR